MPTRKAFGVASENEAPPKEAPVKDDALGFGCLAGFNIRFGKPYTLRPLWNGNPFASTQIRMPCC